MPVVINPIKDGTGPALGGLEDRHKWADHKELLAWVNNPGGYMAKDPYTQGLKAKYGSMMTGFPDVTLKEVDAIVTYINNAVADANKPKATTRHRTSRRSKQLIKTPSSLVLFL